MKIAIYQCEGVPESKAENLKILRRAASSATEQGARLLICAEMFLSVYNIGDAVYDLADRRPEIYKNPIMGKLPGPDE